MPLPRFTGAYAHMGAGHAACVRLSPWRMHSARHGGLSSPGAGFLAITHKNHISISMLSATSIMTDFLVTIFSSSFFIFAQVRCLFFFF
jgi:hypothetical protein